MVKKASNMFTIFICITLLMMCCTACGKSDEDSDNPPSQSTEEGTDKKKNPGDTARISFQIEDYKGNNKVQIPIFSSDLESEAINSLNNSIQEIVTIYKEADANVLKWAEVYTHSYSTDTYLQAVVEYLQMPSLNLDYNVATYVYDRKNDKVVTIEDAIEMAGLDLAEFQELVFKMVEKSDSDDTLSEIKINGFYMNKKGKPEFFVRLYMGTGTNAYSAMCTVIPSKNKLLTTNENGLQIIE